MFKFTFVFFIVLFVAVGAGLQFAAMTLDTNQNTEVQKVLDVAQSPWFFLIYLIPFNIILSWILGRYGISSFAYPYQNSIFRKQFENRDNAKFGEDFLFYLKSMVHTLKSHNGLTRSVVFKITDEESEQD